MKKDQSEETIHKVWKTAAYASTLQILIPICTGIVLFILFLQITKRLSQNNAVPLSLILAFLCTVLIQFIFKTILRKKHQR
ncbi:MAG: hypothetical protein PUA69_08400 [Erysipelotrichaceae bacterium]|nr:hypothetical protein [Erysipelotrichaceae bacterium]